jgi:uncharacterized protein involved in exopolysaccharide biosynthesis
MITPGDSGSSADTDALSVWPYFNLLLRRRKLVVGLPMALAALVVTVSLLRPRQYMANARFIPQEQNTQASSLGSFAAQFGLPLPGASGSGSATPAFYAELLQSKEVLRDVLYSRYWTKSPKPFEGTLLEFFGIREADSTRAVTRGIRRLGLGMSVSTDRATGMVELEIRTRSPELSVQITRRFLDLINEYNLQRRQSAARAEREFVEARLHVAKDSLTAADNAVAAFSRRNRSIQNSPELLAEEGRLQRASSIQSQLYLSLAQRYETAKIEEVRNTPVVTLIESPEGFVAPVGRGTVRNAILALLLGALLAIGIAVLLDAMHRSRHEGSADFGEFESLKAAAAADLRRLVRRAPRA